MAGLWLWGRTSQLSHLVDNRKLRPETGLDYLSKAQSQGPTAARQIDISSFKCV